MGHGSPPQPFLEIIVYMYKWKIYFQFLLENLLSKDYKWKFLVLKKKKKKFLV